MNCVHLAARRPRATAISALLLASVSSAALAAEPGPGAAEVGEVIVTAQRRSEAVSKVPASITAISSETIEKFAISTFADYAKLAPNLAFGYSVGGSSGVSSSRNAVIRGITGTNTTSFYIDDTPLPQSLDPRMFNIDHIEVLRGPQGTLFGASSMGGTIRVITRPPEADQLTGEISVEATTVKESPAYGGEISAVVYAPIIKDQVTASASAYTNYTPGYFQRTYNDPLALNTTGGTQFSVPVPGPAVYVDNVGGSRDVGATGALRITPTNVPDLTLNLMSMYQKKRIDGFNLADYDQRNLVQRRILDVPEAAEDTFIFTAFTANYRTPIGRLVSSTSQFNRDTYDHEDGTDANAKAFATFYSTYPVGPFPLFVKASESYGHTNIFTQEFRFDSEWDLPIQAIIGLFYQRTDQRNSGQNLAVGFGAATGGRYSDNIFSNNSKTVTTQKAAFLGLTYTPFEALQLQAGVRYTQLESEFEGTSTGIYGVPGVTRRNSSGDPVTPRFSAKYTFSPDTMVYATAAQGFRLGGTNSPVTAACAGRIPYPTSSPIPYDSDQLWSYELGLKTKALDNRVAFSGSVYRIDWKEMQQYIVLINGACYAALTVNLGSAVSQGVEMEAQVAVTDGLSVSLSGGYDDAHITDPGSTASNFHKGQALSSVPMWTASASFDYERPTDFGSWFLRGNYTFTGRSISYTQNVNGLERKPYSITDLRAGANIDAYTVSLFIDNVFDARTNLADEAPLTSIVPGRYRYFVGPPRTIGVDVKYAF